MRLPTAFRTVLFSILLLAAVAAAATERTVLFREDFQDARCLAFSCFPQDRGPLPLLH
jgi:hypothetical protein